MAKLKLWVRNLIISLVLVLSVAGVGVGLYFVFQPKGSGTEPDKPRELTPEQRQFISAVSQNPQADVDYDVYSSLVLSDGTTTTPIGVNNIVGKFGKYFVTDVNNNIEIYKEDTGSASLVSTTTEQSITLSKVAINTEYAQIYQKNGNFQLSGDYAMLQKADDSLVIVSLETGNVTLEQNVFDAQEIDTDNPVGSWIRNVAYFGNNFLVVHEETCTRYVSNTDYDLAIKNTIYHLGDVTHPLVFDESNQLLGYQITGDYAQIISENSTKIYSTELGELGDDGRLSLVLPEMTNTATKTTSSDAVATINGTKYSKLQYSTVEFIPGTTFAIVSHKNATTTEKVTPNENGVATEQYDGAFYDDMLVERTLVGTNYQILNYETNEFVAGVQLAGKTIAKTSSIEGYIELLQYDCNNLDDVTIFDVGYATYYDAEFNRMVSYNYRVVGDIIYFTGEKYYAQNSSGYSEPVDVWGDRTFDMTLWNIISKNVYNDIALVQNVSISSEYRLYNLQTGHVYRDIYKFVSQIMNGKVVVYQAAEDEEGESGFYLLDLSNMTKTAIADFDAGSFNLVAGSVGFYFTKGTDNKYTLHFTNGAEDITNILAYDFYGAENQNGVKVPTLLGGKVYVELTVEDESAKRIVAGTALGEFLELSSAEIAEQYPSTLSGSSNSTALARAYISEKGVANTVGNSGTNGNYSYSASMGPGKANLSYTSDASSVPTYTLSYVNSSVELLYTIKTNTENSQSTGSDNWDASYYGSIDSYDSTADLVVTKFADYYSYFNDEQYDDYAPIQEFKNSEWFNKAKVYSQSFKFKLIACPVAFMIIIYSASVPDSQNNGTHYISVYYGVKRGYFIDSRSEFNRTFNGKTYTNIGSTFYHEGQQYLGYGADIPAPELKDFGSDWRVGFLGAKGDGTGAYQKFNLSMIVTSYKQTVTRKYGDVGVEGNVTGSHWLDDSTGVVQYYVYYSSDHYVLNASTCDSNKYIITDASITGEDHTYSGADDGNWYGNFKDGLTCTDWHFGFLGIGSYDSWETFTKLKGVSVTYTMPSPSYGGIIYVASSVTSASPNASHYIESSGCADSGERLYSVNNVYTNIKYGFVKNNNYAGGDTVGTLRTTFKGFVKSSVGFAFDGLYQSDTKIAKNDGTVTSNTLNASLNLYPRQYAKQYTVNVHYSDGNYNKDDKLPTQTTDILPASATQVDTAKYGVIGGTGTILTATKSRTVYYNELISDFDKLWQEKSSGEGDDATIQAPRGYTFAGLYMPKTADSGNKDIVLTKGTMNQNFGRNSSDYFAEYEDKNTDVYTSSGYADPKMKPSIELYAIYTQRSYNWQIDLSGELPTGTSPNMKLHIVDTDGSESDVDWSAAQKLQENLLFCDNSTPAKATPVIPTMYVSDGETYYQVVIESNTNEKANINLSFDQGRAIPNQYSSLKAYSNFVSWGIDGTQGVSGNNSTPTITLNAHVIPMKYTVSYTEEIDDHVYESTNNIVETKLGGVELKEGVTYSRTEGTKKVYQATWTSGGNSGNDKIVYSNFLPGYQITITYKFLDKNENWQILNAQYARKSDDEADATVTFENFVTKISFAMSGNELSVTFENFYGHYAYDATAGRGYFGANTAGAQPTQSPIEVETTITSLAYDLEVVTQIGDSEETQTTTYTQDGKPVADGISNNSVSEVANDRYGDTEQLGRGSTVLVNIGSNLYKRLHERYYVPDSFVRAFNIRYGTDVILSGSFGVEKMRDLAVEMGRATAAITVGGYKIWKYETPNTLYIGNGADALLSDETRFNALLTVMYGRDNNYNPRLTASKITDESPLLYTIIPIVTGTGADAKTAYLVITKYVANASNSNNDFGVATAIMFDIEKDYDDQHKYTVELKTQKIENNIILETVQIGESIGDGVSLDFNRGQSWEGNGTQAGIDNERVKRTNGATVVDDDDQSGNSLQGVAPSDFLIFDIKADKGYYVEKIDISFNNVNYRIAFNGVTIFADGESIMHITYSVEVNGEPRTISPSSWTSIEDLLLEARCIQLESSGEYPALIMQLKFGYVHMNASISVTYGAYTLLRFESQKENGEDADGANIGYVTNASRTEITLKESHAKVVATIKFATAPSAVIALGRVADLYKAIDPETYSSKVLYFFAKDCTATANSNIEINSYLDSDASYQLDKLVSEQKLYKYNTATVEANTSAGENEQDVIKTKLKATSTFDSNKNTNNIVSIAISPKHIDTTIKSNIDFDGNGGYNQSDTFVYEETNVANTQTSEPKRSDTNKYLTHDNFYQINDGQIASTGTTVDYLASNYGTPAQDDDREYYQYGSAYNVFGNKLTLTIATVYGYQFDGFTLKVRFVGDNAIYEVTYNAESTAGPCTVMVGTDTSTARVVGSYTFDGTTFELTISNLASTEFNVKLHYFAKTFALTYDTNAAFGTSTVAESEQTRTFVYNVLSDVNYGTKYLNSDFAHADANVPASQNHGVNYTRVGYDQVGWAFGTSNFDKLDDDGEVRLHGQTTNIDTYENGKSEGYSLSDTYTNLIYKVGRKDVADAGYAWYLSLGSNNANVFGANNSIASANAQITMFAIWNAKEYLIVVDYNDSTTDNGSTQSSKFLTNWVFDQEISVVNKSANSLTFTRAAISTNTISNVYRLGYTFDGWYFVEGTFNDSTGWNNSYLIYANDYTNKPANFVTENGDKAVLDIDVYNAILAQSSWTEIADEYDESMSNYGDRHQASANRSNIDLYAKWTANEYTFVYDLNAVAGNVNNIEYLSYNGAANTQKGVGTTTASFGEQTGTTSITFDTQIGSTLSPATFAKYAYRYGYRFVGWYATRNANQTSQYDAHVEEQTLDASLLMYLMKVYDAYDNASNTEKLIIRDQQEIHLLIAKAQQNLAATNLIDTLVPNVESNKILLHARWKALAYTINFDLDNEGHIDYAWDDADYAVVGSEVGNNTHLIDSNWLTFTLLFDQKFNKGSLNLADANTLHYALVSNQSESYTYYDEGYAKQGTISKKTINFNHYGVSKQISSENDFDLLVKILYSYGYTLGITVENSTYFFKLVRDQLGLVYDGSDFAINGETEFNNAYLLAAKYESDATLGDIDRLIDIDHSGDPGNSVPEHVSDMHRKQDNDESFGLRNFTLFAYWTQKELPVNNNYTTESTVEQYNNSLVTIGQQTISTTANVTYDGAASTSTTTTLEFFAPTGQYAQEIYIDFYDDRLVFENGRYSSRNAWVARLTLYFSWDSVQRTTHFGQNISSGTNPIVAKYEQYQTLEGEVNNEIYIRWNNLQDLTLQENVAYAKKYPSLLKYIAQSFAVKTSKYKTNEDGYEYWTQTLANKNINTSYLDYLNEERFDNNDSNYDINVITIMFDSLKSNFVVSAKNLAQTYQVDYYRYIRPIDSASTKINDDTESDDYGKEYWDSEFYNDWDQYLVYQQLTYRYGEYASMSYGYASNFAFEDWYYYQGHAYAGGTFADYANYDHAGAEAYETHESVENYDHLLDEFGYWTELEYIWSDELGYYRDVDGQIDVYGTVQIAGLTEISIHQYHRYLQTDGNPYFEESQQENGYYANRLYRFDRRAIAGNMSLICLYVPASVHRVHYYSWDANGGYVDRTASSREYIMGEKKDVYVSDETFGSSLIETWILGNNAEYYYVGFSGINQVVKTGDDAGKPTLSAAYAFLAQFLNCTNTGASTLESYRVVNSSKLSISWRDLKLALDSGIILNGQSYSASGETPQEYATNLLRLLVQEYSAPVASRIYGYNGTYLADVDVIKNMTFFDADFQNQVDSIEIPTVMHDEQENVYYYISNGERSKDFNSYAEASAEIQENYCNSIFALVANKFEIDLSSENPTREIVAKLCVQDLNILLNSISIDYFGFILKNPSSVISVYPAGDSTYFAGWYLADSTLMTYLEQPQNKNVVLTFDSSTWNLDSNSFRTLSIVAVNEHPEDGTTTYTLAEKADGSGESFEVSRFHTIDQLTYAIDKLSRVDNDISVFAAFNCYRFEFKNDSDDAVMTSAELQWGSRVADLNGDPYQYQIGNVQYYALNEEKFNQFVEYVKDNNNLPTSLAKAIGGSVGSYVKCDVSTKTEDGNTITYFSAKDNVSSKGIGSGKWYIVACVYNIKEIRPSTVAGKDGRDIIYEKQDGSEVINMVTSNAIVVENDSLNIKTIADLVNGE